MYGSVFFLSPPPTILTTKQEACNLVDLSFFFLKDVMSLKGIHLLCPFGLLLYSFSLFVEEREYFCCTVTVYPLFFCFNSFVCGGLKL